MAQCLGVAGSIMLQCTCVCMIKAAFGQVEQALPGSKYPNLCQVIVDMHWQIESQAVSVLFMGNLCQNVHTQICIGDRAMQPKHTSSCRGMSKIVHFVPTFPKFQLGRPAPLRPGCTTLVEYALRQMVPLPPCYSCSQQQKFQDPHTQGRSSMVMINDSQKQ